MGRFVLSGGPGVGKTTVINILKEKGYLVVPETARIIIEEEKIKDSDVLPWKDLFKFQEQVALRQLEEEEKINSNQAAFFDRSLIDGYAYCVLGNVNIPQLITENAWGRYDLIFFLAPLSQYENDDVRYEDEEGARAVHLAIREAYDHFGYQVVDIPLLSPVERVDLILDNL